MATDSVATQLERGDLSIRVRALSDPHEISRVASLVNRGVLAVIVVRLGVVSAMLFGLDRGPDLTEDLSMCRTCSDSPVCCLVPCWSCEWCWKRSTAVPRSRTAGDG